MNTSLRTLLSLKEDPCHEVYSTDNRKGASEEHESQLDIQDTNKEKNISNQIPIPRR